LGSKELVVMIELTIPAEKFRIQLKECLQKHPQSYRVIKFRKHDHIYNSGGNDGMVYCIESGQVKLLLPSLEGKECLLAIRTAGEIFGELCLSGQVTRIEAAVAMTESVVRQIPYRNFLTSLKNDSLLESLVQYLAVRVSEQQEVIAALTTVNSEQRLAKTLLHLGRLLGRNEESSIRFRQRISHEELSAMVGTTRPRIGTFLKKFRELGLIGMTAEHCLVIKEGKLRNYLAARGFGGSLVNDGLR
jgi:CRP/FNR family cyclic AMP-dependent transcriptional regulator